MPELELTINGGAHRLDAPVGRSLAEVLREDLGFTGTKIACGEGHCGACTVQLDGVPILSCITLAHTVGTRKVTTIEGLRDHPLVHAFVRADALQCGFCTPGQIVSATALVETNPSPTSDEIRHAMAGNLCRCGTYPRIEEAIRSQGNPGFPHGPPPSSPLTEERSGAPAEQSSAPPTADGSPATDSSLERGD